VSKRQENRDFLQTIPPDDVKYIILGFLASEASQSDADTYIRIYELYCLENKSIAEIAKLLDVTITNIEHKIKRIINLVKRNPIIVDELPPDTDIFQIPIERLFLSTRTYQGLKDHDIKTVGDIVRRGETDLFRMKNFGRKSLNELKSVLWTLVSRFHRTPQLQQDIENLKARSDELSKKSGEWSQDDHQQLIQVMGSLESKLNETKNLIELVLKSSTRRRQYVQEGYCIPYIVWDCLWAWSDRERHPEQTILDVLKKS
jgi:hypothetical protein